MKLALAYTAAMPKTRLTANEIRDKAIDVTVEHMRRHGFDRVRLVEIAKDLGVSHAALYTHFADREALLDAVSERWVNALEVSLAAICRKDKDPVAKIHEWFQKLYSAKREKVLGDPELYKSFKAAAEQRKDFYTSHLTHASNQLTRLVEEAAGEKKLTKYPVARTVVLLLEATASFHNPNLLAQRVHEKREQLLKQLLDVVINGL